MAASVTATSVFAGTAEARAYRYHPGFERRLTDRGYHLAAPLRDRLAPGASALAGRDDKAVLERSP
jgi:hypothetical protein